MRLNRFFASAVFVGYFIGSLIGTAVTGSQASAGEFMSPRLASQLDMVEAWNRSISSPAGNQSISGLELHVHSSRPNEYLEVVTTEGVPKSAAKKDAAMKGDAMNGDAMKEAAMMNDAKKGDAMMSDAKKMKDETVPVRVLSRIQIQPEDEDSAVLLTKSKINAFSGSPSSFRGMKEAERVAANEVRRLKRRGITATVRKVVSPRVGLYSIASDGSLEARDAETGQVWWTKRVGDSRRTYYSIGVSDSHLSVVNGGNLIIIDAANGEIEQELVLGRSPIFGAVNAGNYAMIQGVSGGVVCYPLDDLKFEPYFESVNGYAVSQPSQAPGSTKVAWSTSENFVFVMDMEGTPETLFRLKTDGLVSGKIAAANGERFFFGSESGQVYAVRATRNGVVDWSKPFGEPFYGRPIVIEDQLFIRSYYRNLYCLSIKDGTPLWDNTVSGVSELVGTVDDKLFVRQADGSLLAVNRRTGARVGSFPSLQPARTISNALTDRLYLVSERGGVQCLRPTNSELPKLNSAETVEEGDSMQKSAMMEKKTEKSAFGGEEARSADPFGGDTADPFGGGGGGDDPFGGGAADDPFGGGAAEDPFGADPFGN